MNTTPSAAEIDAHHLLARLTPEVIRARLAELKAEQSALKALLHAAMARARAEQDAYSPRRRRPEEVPCD